MSDETGALIDPGGARELFELVLSTDSVESLLKDLAGLAAERVDDNLSCGIAVRHDSQALSVAASDEFASALDGLQFRHGVGPCLHAMQIGEPVEIVDIADELERWQPFSAEALAHGLGACYAVPLGAVGRIWGSLNLYSPKAESLTDTDRHRARNIAAQAGAAVAVAMRMSEQAELSTQLQEALTSRAVIDQALGIVMGAQHCTADEAFEVLRNASQQRNVKLREIAARIVESTIRRGDG